MRTTLTLDDDVAAKLKALEKSERRPFRAIVNDALRAGLRVLHQRPARRTPHRTSGFDLGTSLVGSLDNVEDVLERAEGPNRR
jgi:Arc/MetJ family transcription regulator